MCEVELIVRPWTGTEPTPEGEEPAVMLVTHVIVDGTVIESWDRKSEFLVPRRTALTLGIDGFLEITMQDPPPWIVAKYADTADHLEGSSDSLLMLPVTKLTVTPFSAARNNELLPTHA